MLYDLLSPVPGTPENLQIVDEGGATVVKGLTQVQVSTQEEALALLFEGDMPLHHRCVFVSLLLLWYKKTGFVVLENIASLHCIVFMRFCHICIMYCLVDQNCVSLWVTI